MTALYLVAVSGGRCITRGGWRRPPTSGQAAVGGWPSGTGGTPLMGQTFSTFVAP